MHSHSLPSHLAHLENIAPAFLDPTTSFVVMPEAAEHDLDNAQLALDAMCWLLESIEDANAALLGHGGCTKLSEVPPDSLAALLRLVRDKITPHTNNPTLFTVQQVRPDLFPAN